jgi:acyl-CoA thioesterase FadM
MEMTRHSVTVRLHHTDAAGVLFYSRLFELVQEAFETAMETAGLPLGELLRDGGFRIPVVHAQADYRAPVRVGDALDVRLSFAAGNRSLRVGADFVDAAGRQVAAVRVVHAAVNQATGTAVPLPDALRALAG